MTDVVHKDKLGSSIFIGAYVAVADHNKLTICKVIKITNMMIRVVRVGRQNDRGRLVYSSETVILSGEDVLAYILKL